MTSYSSLGHSSIPVQFSETSLNCTNQSIRGEIAPPIRAKDKGGVLINPQCSFADTKCHTLKVGMIREQQLKGTIREQ